MKGMFKKLMPHNPTNTGGDLGVKRVASSDIPKQSKTSTKSGDSMSNDKVGGKKSIDIAKKMKKYMSKKGLI
jgi:hypothetical protein